MSDDASPAPAQPGCKGKGSERLVVNFESEPDCRLWRTRSSLGKKLHHDANSSKCTFGGSLVVNGYFALASWEVPPGLKRGKSQPLFGAHGLVLKAKADGRALQFNVTVRTGKMINNRLEGGFEVCSFVSPEPACSQSPHAHRARMLTELPCLFAPHTPPPAICHAPLSSRSFSSSRSFCFYSRILCVLPTHFHCPSASCPSLLPLPVSTSVRLRWSRRERRSTCSPSPRSSHAYLASSELSLLPKATIPLRPSPSCRRRRRRRGTCASRRVRPRRALGRAWRRLCRRPPSRSLL